MSQCTPVPAEGLLQCDPACLPHLDTVLWLRRRVKWAWECWEHLDCAFHSSNPGFCGYFSGELPLCYPQNNTHMMSVFLHSQHECLNVHKMERCCAKYAHVTGVRDSLWCLFVCLAHFLFHGSPVFPCSFSWWRLSTFVGNFLCSS